MVSIRALVKDEEFERTLEIQLASSDDHLSKESWDSFYRQQMIQYRKMIDKKMGFWFGAFLGTQVASLGLFAMGEKARYQSWAPIPIFKIEDFAKPWFTRARCSRSKTWVLTPSLW